MGKPDRNRLLCRIVFDGLRRKDPEHLILVQLVAMGVPEDEAPELYASIKHAIQAGVQAAFTDDLSAPDGPPSDPLLGEAYRQGKVALLGSVPRVHPGCLVIPLGLMVLLTILVIGHRLGWWGV